MASKTQNNIMTLLGNGQVETTDIYVTKVDRTEWRAAVHKAERTANVLTSVGG